MDAAPRRRAFLPVVTYPDITAEATLAAAVAAAAALAAELTACLVEVDIPKISNPVADALARVGELSAAAEHSSARAAAAAGESLGQFGRTAGVAVALDRQRWRLEHILPRLAQRARTYDLSLTEPSAVGNIADAGEAMVFGSGGPVLVLPPEGGALSLDNAAIAWDGSRSAARAVRDALGLLAPGARVVVLTQSADKPIAPESIDGLLEMLAAHGMAARHLEVRAGRRSLGQDLQSAALSEGAGLLVMGAYGHSRLREFILGGATREVLTATELAVLLSH